MKPLIEGYPRITLVILGEIVLDRPISDNDLIRKCLDGDEAAWHHFFSCYKDVIQGTIYATLKRFQFFHPDLKEACQELFQEVAVALLKNNGYRLKHYQSLHGSSFSAWLRVVVSRLVIDHLRKKQLPECSLETINNCKKANTHHHLQNPENNLNDKEALEFVRSAIDQLSSMDRLIMRLIYESGATPKQTASIVGLNPGAVYTRVHRILAGIRAKALKKGLI